MRALSKPKNVLVIALLVIGAAVPALAQPRDPNAYPACDPTKKPTAADEQRAGNTFLAGKDFKKEGNYDKAISYYRDAYSIDCTKPIVLQYIGELYELKQDRAEAVRAYEEYLKRVPDASDKEQIERRIKNLKDQMASSPTPPQAASGAPSSTGSSSAAPSTTPSSTTAPTNGAPQRSITPLIVAGAGGAVLVAGVIVFLVGSGKVSSAESKCPSRQNCSAQDTATGNDGRSLELAGGIVGGIGAAGVAAGLAWYFLQPPPRGAASARVTPDVGVGYAGVRVGGTF